MLALYIFLINFVAKPRHTTATRRGRYFYLTHSGGIEIPESRRYFSIIREQSAGRNE